MAFHFNTFLAAAAIAGAVRFPQAEKSGPAMIAAAADDMAMQPSPIEPSWIISGEPFARSAEHSQSDDDAAITAVWDCTAGVFNWFYGWDETVMILEGEVHVTDEDGVTRTLRAGDIAYFKGRTWATWRIDHYVRKIAFVRRPFPGPVALAIRLRNKLAQLRSKAPLRSGL